MNKKFGVVLVAMGVMWGLSGTAMAASAPGAEKLPLVGPAASVICNPPQDPSSSDDASETLDGFVIFNYSADDGTIKATVSIKGGEPNTEYPVRLVQNNADCFTVDGVLTTNRQGKGTLNIREAAVSGSAQVIVDTGAIFDQPSYRATESYSW